jgi:DNA-binding transcriptional ArsR family regulator
LLAVDPLRDLTDPRAMRALAHPLRLRMLRLLQQEGPATATTLARICDESTGATSFHLRQLAKYGFIEDAPNQGGGRERWWRARARGLRFGLGGPDIDVAIAAGLLRRHLLDQNAQRLAEYLESEANMSPAWREAALFANASGYLTPEELEQVGERLVELLQQFDRPDRAQRPPGAGRVDFILYGLPRPRP